jgi:cellulose synthase/poly-beta-1,6-N-acetylglucosamine synthase-like glycosyltransferase
LFSALGTAAALATVPGTLEILFLTAGAARRARQRGYGRQRSIRLAIVIPAHNEAGLIGRCVASVAASAPSPGYREIVVVADNCTDETARLATEAGARVLVRQNAQQRGRGYALRLAFNRLQAEGFDSFLIVDADSVVSPNLVCEVVERLNAGAAAVQCRYRVANASTSLRTQLMDVAFLAFNVLRSRGRSGWGVSVGILGNGFALHGETLQNVPYTAVSIVEDLEYHLRLVAASERVDFIDEATVFGEIPAGSKAARAQRSRWEGGRLRMAREWAPRLVAGIARGQWRLTEPLLDLLTFPLAYQVLLLSLSIFLPAPFRQYAVGALGLVATHVLCASLLGDRPWKTVLALASTPLYMLWKVTTLDAVLSSSRREALWVRTDRDYEAALRTAK